MRLVVGCIDFKCWEGHLFKSSGADNFTQAMHNFSDATVLIRRVQNDAFFENYLIEEQDGYGSGLTSVMSFVSLLQDISWSALEYLK
ncbi:hypothetical protein CMV_019670 [Castanea mollissima]|uniref:Uncharacterized protein n=1 Tax=Castanea mollissima TaxID=60419 RepID=A0A8J4QZY1_9ROSI|nr:hypothetical protein CMV_019670 [Castanea mollissima]